MGFFLNSVQINLISNSKASLNINTFTFIQFYSLNILREGIPRVKLKIFRAENNIIPTIYNGCNSSNRDHQTKMWRKERGKTKRNWVIQSQGTHWMVMVYGQNKFIDTLQGGSEKNPVAQWVESRAHDP